jgi:hypothetical protein
MIGLSPLRCALLVLLTADLAVAQSPQPYRLVPQSTSTVAIANLPKPRIAAGELPRPCAKSYTELKRIAYLTPEVESRFNSEPMLRATLQEWASKNLGMSNYLCLDWPYAVSKFHEATGAEAGTVLTAADADRLAAALSAGRKEIATVAAARTPEALNKTWRTGVTLFEFELGALLPQLPKCQFSLADQSTCYTGNPTQGSLDLYFSASDRPALLADVNVKVLVKGVEAADSAYEWRVVGMTFKTWRASLPEFERKFGQARATPQMLQNAFGAHWQADTFTWQPAQGVSVQVRCGTQFGNQQSCEAAATMRLPQSAQPKDVANTGRKL